MNLFRMFRTSLALAAVIVAIAWALPASAGCLQEFGECGACARKHLREALWDLDLGGMMDAEVEAIDCEIDFIHCVLFAHHHDYDCSS